MKNKARCKHFKKILACFALVFFLISISVPCFAVSNSVYTSNFPSAKFVVPDGGWTVENCEAVTEIVEMAYKLNYFSGGIPVAICRNNFNYILVYVVVPVHRSIRIGPTGNQYYGPSFASSSAGIVRDQIYGYFDSDVNAIFAKNSATDIPYCMMEYVFSTDNNFIFNNNSIAISNWNNDNPYISIESPCIFASGQSGISVISTNTIIGLRLGNDHWQFTGDSDYFSGYYNGYGESVSDNLSSVVSLYESRSMNEVVNNFNYDLDIPSIITAIPNGAKQIINNVFGFEIFGINVAGLLSVLLIFAIVGFVIKKLIK